MAPQHVIDAVHRYLHRVQDAQIPVRGAVLYGSFARGDYHDNSDIDLLVVVDDTTGPKELDELWTRLGALTWGFDTRIEPIPVTQHWLQSDDPSPILYAARTEGIPIAA